MTLQVAGNLLLIAALIVNFYLMYDLSRLRKRYQFLIQQLMQDICDEQNVHD